MEGRFATRGWKGEGREVTEGRFAARGGKGKGGEEGKERRNGELTLTPEP